MKGTFFFQAVLLIALGAYGQSRRDFIVLTVHDVHTNSVRLITGPTFPVQNVVFRYAGKTSAEIKAIADSHVHAKIMRDCAVVAETGEGDCIGYFDGHTNYVGLVLIFKEYDDAKAAKRALRGENP
jgi:hypothetical protein